MARKQNHLSTIQVTLSLTPGLQDYLGDLVSTHLYGKNPAEAALRLIERGIEGLLKEGTLRKRPKSGRE